jgi:hypothetical protein
MPALSVLVQLIEAMNPYQLQEVALRYLSLRGFRNPSLTDGWNDGGTDLRVMRADGVPSRLVVQTSVQRKWKEKLTSDIEKAYNSYKCNSFIYISSRRLAELDFQRIADDALLRHQVTVTKADSQALASIFYSEGKSSEILEISGIQEHSRPSSAPTPTFKRTPPSAIYSSARKHARSALALLNKPSLAISSLRPQMPSPAQPERRLQRTLVLNLA